MQREARASGAAVATPCAGWLIAEQIIGQCASSSGRRYKAAAPLHCAALRPYKSVSVWSVIRWQLRACCLHIFSHIEIQRHPGTRSALVAHRCHGVLLILRPASRWACTAVSFQSCTKRSNTVYSVLQQQENRPSGLRRFIALSIPFVFANAERGPLGRGLPFGALGFVFYLAGGSCLSGSKLG